MEKKTVSSMWRVAAIILGMATASLAWELHQTRQAIKNAFHYHHHVTVVDADTGATLRPAIEHPTMSSDDIISQPSGTMAHEDGSVTLMGMGYRPRTFQFGMEGYQPESLTIGRESTFYDDVRIKLKRQGAPERSQ